MEPPIVWEPVQPLPRMGSRLAPEGLTATLRTLRIGERVLVPGWTATRCANYTRAARLKTDKWFAAQTTEGGALILREK